MYPIFDIIKAVALKTEAPSNVPLFETSDGLSGWYFCP